jgi:transposase-like protein
MPAKTPKPQPKAKTGGKVASKAKAGRPAGIKNTPDTYRDVPLSALLDRIASGDSVSSIAREIGVTPYALQCWLNHEQRQDQYQAALTASADSIIDKAEAAILDENLDVARARELANHYRHVAKARNPRRWGDKQQIEMSGELATRNLTDEDLNRKLAQLISNVGATE